MNLSTEENNLPLFKYTPEITSQLLIQTNDSQEFVQVPNICDDLLTGLEDGTVTWTLGGLPILLNGQNDSQPFFVNSTNDRSLGELQPHQETLKDILEQENENQFGENNVEADDTEIIYPLEITDKHFLTDNGLFMNNEVLSEQTDVSPSCELVSNNITFHSEIADKEDSEVKVESEIQSSDVSSQEAFIDVNGMLISQQSVLNLNCPDLLFNIQESLNNSSKVILNRVSSKKKINALKRKRNLNASISFLKNSVKNDSDLIQNYNKSEEIVQNLQNEIETNQNSIFGCDSVNNLIKILNIDGSTTILNINGTLFNDKSVSNDASNIVAYDDSATDELKVAELPVDDEPDSTVTNDTDDTLNIDDLATIITAYQCKKCEFTCNDRDHFLTHFKEAHIKIEPLVLDQFYEVQPDFVVQNSVENVKNIFISKDLNINQRNKRIKIPCDKNVQSVNVLCTNGKISVIDNEAIPENKTTVTTLNEDLLNPENLSLSKIKTIQQSQRRAKQEQINIIQTENNSAFNNCLQTTKFIYGNEEFTGITFVAGEEKEKKIMRVKKRKKSSKKIKLLNIPQEPILYVSNLLLDTNAKHDNDSNISTQISEIPYLKTSTINSEIPEKQLIFICSQCADQFLTVEDCKVHMIKVHKLCAVETIDEPQVSSEDNIQVGSTDSLLISDDKNKEMINKILCQDVLKPRRHRCPVRGCQYRFAKLELLARHETCHVSGSRKQFRCPECNEMQPSWRTCSIHLWRCHQLDLDLYACPFCNYKGSTSVKLKHHVKIHSEEREYICPECGRGFKQPSQLRNHRVIHLDNQPRWCTQQHCDKCGKIFADSKCLKKHIQAVHSKLKPFICNVCGHSCARKAMLQMHLRQHTGEKPYSCTFCYYKTGDHNSLRRHKMRHSGARPYKCPHCDYTAIQSNSYKNHLASKHPGMSGAFNCRECPFKTINEEAYTTHMNDHRNSLSNKSSVGPQNLRHDVNTSSSEMSCGNENLIFSTSRGSHKNNISIKKNFDIEDDETQNCFLSLSDLTDEQTVDTGGITIPADADDPEPLNI